ncbi:MAG: DNA polymerase III subunit alpha, partial [Pedobacter sp.]|nr:DNA polymerase III subunit alpha [Pedobacter sp.]
MYLIFDTETTGLPRNYNAPISDVKNWPRCIQIAWQLHDEMGRLVAHESYLVKPYGFNIPYDAERIHGISTELAEERGIVIEEVLQKFLVVLSKTKFIVGQNLGFDVNIMGAEFFRVGINQSLVEIPLLDTCTEITAGLLKLPGGRGGKFKLPTLTELHQYLFGSPFNEAHNATADVEATSKCFFELIRTGGFLKEQLLVDAEYFPKFKEVNPAQIKSFGIKHINLKSASEEIRKRLQKNEGAGISKEDIAENKEELVSADFAHLHNHTQFSVLQSTISISDLIKAAA